ncbi:MAG: hypothetical protein PARBA_02048 [Parabacteroides sp.]|jgi:hypothetical protein
MKVPLIVSVLLFFCIPAAFGQNIAVKSNLLSDAATTLNLGAEFGLSPRWTIDFSASYNPWTFSGNRKLKQFFVQPEARYWLCERFNGHFFGVHLLGGAFNIEGIPLPGLSREFRYEGWAGGAGVSYGYQWMIGRRWNLEASLGLGYMYARYDKYECAACGRKLEAGRTKGFFAPTKACISIIYLIK